MAKKTKGKPDKIDKFVGKKLQKFRHLAGVSQERLANSIGLSFQQIQKYERGTNRISCSRLYNFAIILDKSILDFYPKGTK